MERIFLASIVLAIFICFFDYLSKWLKKNDCHHLYYVTLVTGIYLPILIYTVYCGFLMTESHEAFVLVAFYLSLMVLSWIIYHLVFVHHKYNYLFLALVIGISYYISFEVIPKYSLMIIPSLFFSVYYGSSLVGVSKIKVNTSKMFVVTLVLGLCFISSYLYQFEEIQSQTVPIVAVKAYLEKENLGDHKVRIIGDTNTRHDKILVFCLPPNEKKYLVLDYYKGQVIKKN